MKTLHTATVKAFEAKAPSDSLDGWKTWIALGLILVSGALDTVGELITQLPDIPILAQIETALLFLNDLLQRLSGVGGAVLLPIGLIHKVWKWLKALGT
jgi:hypothetical protein